MKLDEAIQLEEGISPVLYHATSLNNFIGMANSNKIKLSRDPTMKGRFYMSFSRNKTNDFIPYLKSLNDFDLEEENFNPRNDAFAVIEFDGRQLGYNYSGRAFNTFYVPDDEDDPSENPNFMEDRLYNNKPYIENARRYIRSISIVTNGKRITQSAKTMFSRLASHFGQVLVYDDVIDYIRLNKPIETYTR